MGEIVRKWRQGGREEKEGRKQGGREGKEEGREGRNGHSSLSVTQRSLSLLILAPWTSESHFVW